MAPTVCLSELPIVRSTVSPYSRRRQSVHNRVIAKQQRLELRRMEMNQASNNGMPLTPPESPLWEPGYPSDSCPPTIVTSSSNISARIPSDKEEHWKVFLARREGLLNIFVRTIALVRRNNILQERVNALRAETRDFIESVLNNPENKCRQQRIEGPTCKEETVSSSTEKVISRPSLPPTPDSTSCSSSSDVTSTWSSSDLDDEEMSSSSEES